MIHIIGAGGIGGWLATLLSKTVRNGAFRIYDKDTWEPKNLDRQMATEADLGLPKATTLAARLGLNDAAVVAWFVAQEHAIGIKRSDFLFCGADNHPARAQVLQASDISGAPAIIAGNEYSSASAYYYRPAWRNTHLDPRIRYPELVTDHRNAAGSPCTGEAQESNKQLALSNYMAAGYAVWLYWFWSHEYSRLSPETREYAPLELNSGAHEVMTIKCRDVKHVC
jgi:molybdopterin/thiamine biosynthesis adenylyltransferase